MIHLIFSNPGNWDDFTLLAHWQDADGYRYSDKYGPEDIPAGQAPALQAVVAALVGLAEPWQATQVWARRESAPIDTGERDAQGAPVMGERAYLSLTVEARKPGGGAHRFTVDDYPAFRLTDDASLDFFAHFTHA